ncbi:hypothetical protein [Kosakonia sp. WA-90]
MMDMKRLIISLLLISPAALATDELSPPESAVLNFNQWDIGQR